MRPRRSIPWKILEKCKAARYIVQIVAQNSNIFRCILIEMLRQTRESNFHLAWEIMFSVRGLKLLLYDGFV